MVAPVRNDAASLFDEASMHRLRRLRIAAGPLAAMRGAGQRASRTPGQGLEFADYRAYQTGDDLRHVDWGAYRRLGRLLVRLREQERAVGIYLLLDTSASMGFGAPSKLAAAQRLAAALSYLGVANHDPVTLVTLGAGVAMPVPTLRSARGLPRLLRALRDIEAQGPTDLAQSLGQFVAPRHPRGIAVLLSDLFDPAGVAPALDRLRDGGHQVHVLQLVSAMDAVPAGAGDLELVDVERGIRRRATVTRALARRYRAAYAAFMAETADACQARGARHAVIPAGLPVAQAVLDRLAPAGVVVP